MREIPKLYADVSGSGQTVVLLHGIFSSGRYWDKVTSLLEADHKVIAIDLLGFGKSPKPRSGRYDYDDHIAAINKTLEEHNVNEPFILIGHSMGALIALRYSVKFEKRVQKLILTNMPVMIGLRQVRREILGTNRLHRFGLERGIHRVTWAVFRTLYRLRWLPSKMHEKLATNDYFFQHTANSRIRSFQNIIGQARVDIDLARVRVKTVLLSGLEDRKIYLDTIAQQIPLRPHVTHIRVPTGHHIPCKFPEIISRNVI